MDNNNNREHPQMTPRRNYNDMYEPKKRSKWPVIILVIAVLMIGSNLGISFVGFGMFNRTSSAITSGAVLPVEGLQISQPITGLSTSLISNAITVEHHDGSYIFVIYTPPTRGSYMRPIYQFSQNGTKLEIAEESRRQLFNWNVSLQSGMLSIYIPRSMNNDLELLDITTVSGMIEIIGDNGAILADRVNAGAASGGILAENFTSGNVSASVISGGIRANNIVTENAAISTVSGGITVNSLVADMADLSTVSGGITADNLTLNTLSALTTSGGINISDSTISGSTNGRTVSGGLTFANVDADENQMSLSTTSGRITVNGQRW